MLLPGPKALFLRCYATYIAGERSKEQQVAEASSAAAAAELVNEVSSCFDIQLAMQQWFCLMDTPLSWFA